MTGGVANKETKYSGGVASKSSSDMTGGAANRSMTKI